MILYPYVEGEKAYIRQPRAVEGEYLYFYTRVIVEFIFCIPFTIF